MPPVFQDLIAHRHPIDEVVASHRGVRWYALAEATLNLGVHMDIRTNQDAAVAVVVEFARHADILDLSDMQQALSELLDKPVTVISSRGITHGMMAMTVAIPGQRQGELVG